VKSFELRLEVRYDSAQTQLFLRDPSRGTTLATLTPAEYADSLSQIAIQGLYKF
jgi:hypothetical protein